MIFYVTPYAGVWIEIDKRKQGLCECFVTPYAGVWIEIYRNSDCGNPLLSLPTRECGLKLLYPLINRYVQ